MTALIDLNSKAIEDIVWYLDEVYEIYYNEDMADESRRDFRDYTKALKWTLYVLNKLKEDVDFMHEEERKKEAFKESYEYHTKIRQAQQQLAQLRKLEG